MLEDTEPHSQASPQRGLWAIKGPQSGVNLTVFQDFSWPGQPLPSHLGLSWPPLPAQE